MSQQKSGASPDVRRPPIEPTIRRRTRIVSPDGTRSAIWDGTVDPGNTLVFRGPRCEGTPLFACTLVYAGSPELAALAAAYMGMAAAKESLGAGGSTGPRAQHLYFCKPARPAPAHGR
jgi:hypothetical protein